MHVEKTEGVRLLPSDGMGMGSVHGIFQKPGHFVKHVLRDVGSVGQPAIVACCSGAAGKFPFLFRRQTEDESGFPDGGKGVEFLQEVLAVVP